MERLGEGREYFRERTNGGWKNVTEGCAIQNPKHKRGNRKEVATKGCRKRAEGTWQRREQQCRSTTKTAHRVCWGLNELKTLKLFLNISIIMQNCNLGTR